MNTVIIFKQLYYSQGQWMESQLCSNYESNHLSFLKFWLSHVYSYSFPILNNETFSGSQSNHLSSEAYLGPEGLRKEENEQQNLLTATADELLLPTHLLLKHHQTKQQQHMVLFPITIKILWYLFLIYRKMYQQEKVPIWYFFLRKKNHTQLGTFSHWYFFLVLKYRL